jgi:3-oxoacid CoA-transferase subunit A/glutaconate CoA-transferase subunit A
MELEILQTGAGEMLQPFDLDEFREWNRSRKSHNLRDKRMTEQEAIEAFVSEGCYLGTELYGTVRAPMSLTREIIRQGIGNLRVCGQGVLELDMLIAAGLVTAADVTYIGLEVYGVSAPLRRAVESGRMRTVEWSNAAITWRFKAAAMGVPFLPVRTMLGTDTLKYSAAKVARDPFTGIQVALIPALILDVGLIHVHRADRYGNCQIEGISGFAVEMSRASKRLIISAEEIVDTDVIRCCAEHTCIPYYLVDAVVEAPFGSHPGEMAYLYGRDEPEIKAWVDASQTEEGAAAYLQEWVTDLPSHEAYLEKLGIDQRFVLQILREVR